MKYFRVQINLSNPKLNAVSKFDTKTHKAFSHESRLSQQAWDAVKMPNALADIGRRRVFALTGVSMIIAL